MARRLLARASCDAGSPARHLPRVWLLQGRTLLPRVRRASRLRVRRAPSHDWTHRVAGAVHAGRFAVCRAPPAGHRPRGHRWPCGAPGARDGRRAIRAVRGGPGDRARARVSRNLRNPVDERVRHPVLGRVLAHLGPRPADRGLRGSGCSSGSWPAWACRTRSACCSWLSGSWPALWRPGDGGCSGPGTSGREAWPRASSSCLTFSGSGTTGGPPWSSWRTPPARRTSRCRRRRS